MVVVYGGRLGTVQLKGCSFPANVLFVVLNFCCLLGGYNKDTVNCVTELIESPQMRPSQLYKDVSIIFVQP